jgi:uncharacterized membrane protein
MISYESTVTIGRPAADVFAMIAEPARMDEWTGMSDNRWLTPGPHGAGSQLTATMPLGPFRRTVKWEVTDYQPGRIFAVRSLRGGPIDWTGMYELRAQGSQTVVTSRGQVKPNGLLRVLEPLMRGELPREEAKEPERLKELVEREGATGER